MSTEKLHAPSGAEGEDEGAGAPGPPPGDAAHGPLRLSELGMRIELLRIRHGISKQHLARLAGVSRQQLWRVLTGKSELTSSMCNRLAEVLKVVPQDLACPSNDQDTAARARTRMPRLPSAGGDQPSAHSRAATERLLLTEAADVLEQYVHDERAIARTLDTMPAGEMGWRLRRGYLDALEELAASRGVRLPATFFTLRRRVVNREL